LARASTSGRKKFRERKLRYTGGRHRGDVPPLLHFCSGGGRYYLLLPRLRKNFRRGPVFGTAPDGSGRGSHGPSLLETFPAVYGSPLGWLEGNRGFLPALRACGTRFRSLVIPRGRRSAALGLACLAPFGLVLEALVGEEHLLAAGEDKFSAALDAFQYPVLIFHFVLRGP
jgi:hypothetical protein